MNRAVEAEEEQEAPLGVRAMAGQRGKTLNEECEDEEDVD